MQKNPSNPFLTFSHRGWLAEWAQQQTSHLLLPSISYPETWVSLFTISRKMYSCSHPSYPRFKTLLWNFKGSVRLFKDSDAWFYFWKHSVQWTGIVWCLKNSPTSAFPWSAGSPASTGLCQECDSSESKAYLSRKKNWPAPLHLWEERGENSKGQKIKDIIALILFFFFFF